MHVRRTHDIGDWRGYAPPISSGMHSTNMHYRIRLYKRVQLSTELKVVRTGFLTPRFTEDDKARGIVRIKPVHSDVDRWLSAIVGAKWSLDRCPRSQHK